MSTVENSGSPKAKLSHALKMALKMGWDRLGTLIAVSLTWTLLLTIPIAIGGSLPHSTSIIVRYVVMMTVGALVLSAPTAAACHIAHLICSNDETTYLDFWQGVVRFWGTGTRLGLIHLIVLIVLAANLLFYGNLKSVTGAAATLLCGYLFLMWSMMSVYHFTLLVAQENGMFDDPDRKARRGALAAIRRAFYLALGRPLYTFGLLIAILGVSAFCFGVVVLTPLLWIGGLSMITTVAARLLLIEYGVLPMPLIQEEIVPDEKFRIKI